MKSKKTNNKKESKRINNYKSSTDIEQPSIITGWSINKNRKPTTNTIEQFLEKQGKIKIHSLKKHDTNSDKITNQS